MELDGKRVMVVGMGVSGRAAAHFLAARGADLVMTDRREHLEGLTNPNARDGLRPPGRLLLGSENPAWLEGVDLVVISPGVPRTAVLVAAAYERGIPVIGELELAARFINVPIAAVTGTNGKSTVTTLLGEIFRSAGRKVFVGGNLGAPLIEAVGMEIEAAVAEVSSYQLETVVHFKPHVGVHLNLSDDHLDRYRGRDEYAAAKARLFENQDGGDWAILNRDDPEVWKLGERLRARVLSFGLKQPAHRPALWCEADDIIFDDGRGPTRISLRELRLPGAHNRVNGMAAAAAALAMGISPEPIERALAAFRGLPHRLEQVGERAGVRYVDDSKGTNVGAVLEALAAVSPPVVLIAGGVDKGGSYSPLRSVLVDKVRLLILIGAAREQMKSELAGTTVIECVETLGAAVALAANRARPGDTVLLSPACSSFDQFKDYAERGRIFQELVRAI